MALEKVIGCTIQEHYQYFIRSQCVCINIYITICNILFAVLYRCLWISQARGPDDCLSCCRRFCGLVIFQDTLNIML